MRLELKESSTGVYLLESVGRFTPAHVAVPANVTAITLAGWLRQQGKLPWLDTDAPTASRLGPPRCWIEGAEWRDQHGEAGSATLDDGAPSQLASGYVANLLMRITHEYADGAKTTAAASPALVGLNNTFLLSEDGPWRWTPQELICRMTTFRRELDDILASPSTENALALWDEVETARTETAVERALMNAEEAEKKAMARTVALLGL